MLLQLEVDALRTTNAELERRVLERTQELELFSYSVAHDLRAPLRAIQGFAAAMLEDHGATLHDDAKLQLARVVASGVRMGALVDGLLALWRVTRSEMRREPVNVTALATSVADELRASEPTRDVELRIARSLEAVGDPNLLRTLLHCLLDNAWKFTRKRTTARIEIAHDDGVFRIQDNGAGFDMQHAKLLFAPFQRLHPARDVAGTGIGLAIAARICQRHGGRIWAEATPNEGSSFSFTLNLEKEL